jgi:hypothetical protein
MLPTPLTPTSTSRSIGSVENRRRVGLGLAVAMAVLLASCLPPASTEPSPSTGAPSVSPAPSSSAEPSPVAACDESAHAAGALILRLEHFTETGRNWVISLYDDGRILTPGPAAYEYSEDAWMIVRWLTQDGIDALANTVLDTGLFEASGSYNPVLLPGAEHPGRGGSGYSVVVRRDSEYVEVGWTSLWGDDDLYYEPSPEREELDAMGAELVALDEWLPKDGWLSGEPCPYEPQTYRVIVTEPQPWGGSLDDLPADIADITWPLGGDFLAWGEPFSNPGGDPDIDGRCGVVTRAEAIHVVDELLAAGVEGPASLAEVKRYLMLRLGDRAGVQVHDVTLEGMLPDGPTDCSDAHSPGLMPI